MKPSFTAEKFSKPKSSLNVKELHYFKPLLGFALLYPAYSISRKILLKHKNMQVLINANGCDQQTLAISDCLRDPFNEISKYLSQEYGGDIEHLWIDFELIACHADLRPPYPFRYQKRVSGYSKLTGFDLPDSFNVGHYSVRPDFVVLLEVPDVVTYALQVIFESTAILNVKQKKLGGFNVQKFRIDFFDRCKALGYNLNDKTFGVG
ncbi:hypothetical protein [Methylomonas fluvii]|uniref:Uncharacterized protein n=1 Tax=Methylomonas fluvii TaxID=1854564 RepID=A0ABR9DHD0_9GAMM|nr:hypothetical protein [Methylomonas fluvii]MBD9361297.1 hypothetical protein [Methylomonas fluvii]